MRRSPHERRPNDNSNGNGGRISPVENNPSLPGRLVTGKREMVFFTTLNPREHRWRGNRKPCASRNSAKRSFYSSDTQPAPHRSF
ncbi:hypothetical protein TNCV_1665671 [Trichonephila clavipes]|nr:hypothetical protein TNCV_1665671 [Trichonephila clavipes]